MSDFSTLNKYRFNALPVNLANLGEHQVVPSKRERKKKRFKNRECTVKRNKKKFWINLATRLNLKWGQHDEVLGNCVNYKSNLKFQVKFVQGGDRKLVLGEEPWNEVGDSPWRSASRKGLGISTKYSQSYTPPLNTTRIKHRGHVHYFSCKSELTVCFEYTIFIESLPQKKRLDTDTCECTQWASPLKSVQMLRMSTWYLRLWLHSHLFVAYFNGSLRNDENWSTVLHQHSQSSMQVSPHFHLFTPEIAHVLNRVKNLHYLTHLSFTSTFGEAISAKQLLKFKQITTFKLSPFVATSTRRCSFFTSSYDNRNFF